MRTFAAAALVLATSAGASVKVGTWSQVRDRCAPGDFTKKSSGSFLQTAVKQNCGKGIALLDIPDHESLERVNLPGTDYPVPPHSAGNGKAMDPPVWVSQQGICLRKDIIDRDDFPSPLNPDAMVLDEMLSHGFWEQDEELDIAATIKENADCKHGNVFLDIGAAYGYYSFLSRKIAPCATVHAFNPNSQFASVMREMSLVNGYKAATQTCLHNRLVGASNDVHGHHLGYGVATGEAIGGAVGQVTIDTFMSELMDQAKADGAPAPKVFALKMDIQGAEVDALAGASSTLAACVIPKVFVSCHGVERKDKVLATLTKSGYTIIKSMPPANGNWDFEVTATCVPASPAHTEA